MLVREAVEVANAVGMHFDYDAAFAHVIDIALITGGNICSMLADVNNRRRTEVDRINGAIVSEAAKVGTSAPLNEMITALIHAKEKTY
jgi:2-dehydropantoate 2-reductase